MKKWDIVTADVKLTSFGTHHGELMVEGPIISVAGVLYEDIPNKWKVSGGTYGPRSPVGVRVYLPNAIDVSQFTINGQEI